MAQRLQQPLTRVDTSSRVRMRKQLISFLMFLFLAVAVPTTAAYAQGCAMCKTALEQSPEGRQMAKSFDYAILFLMGFPYAMIGAAGIAIYRAYRTKNREEVRSE